MSPYTARDRHSEADGTPVKRFGNSSFKSRCASWNAEAEKNFKFMI